MITMFNNDSKRQTILFEQAWDYLKTIPESDGGLTEADREAASSYGKNTFSDLAHYFAYLPALIRHKPKFLMMPIDEAPFEIKANTREIKVPPEFTKCSGVQSDNYAEIITFTINRYFDYKDLSNANIAVQWINEAANKEGVSFIDLVDIETYGDEDKIRFGWPLTAEMTAAAGNLRFAVRFYTAEEIGGSLTFNYLLNTTPASIPIKETLNVDLNGKNVIKNNKDYEIFLNTVTSSLNPSYAIPTPVTFKSTPDSIEAIILSDDKAINNTLELQAEATTADGNAIIYEWYYVAPGFRPYVPYDENGVETTWPTVRPATTFYKLNENYEEGSEEADKKDKYIAFTEAWPTEKPDEDILVLYVQNPIRKIQDNDDFSISLKYSVYKPDIWPGTRPGDVTFWRQDSKAPNGYVRYGINEPWPIYVETEEEKEKLQIEAGKEVLTTLDIVLYTYKSVLKFENTNAEITGQYFVRGINRKNNINKVHTDAPATYTSILAPETIEITTNLPEVQAFSENQTLNLILKKDDGKPLLTYKLYKDGEELTSSKRIPDNKVEFILKDDPENKDNRVFGSYQIKIKSELNREFTETSSNICTVYDDPLKPDDCELVVKKLSSIEDPAGTEMSDYVETPVKNAFYLDTKDSSGIYKLTVDTTSWKSTNSNNYNIGNLTYEWTFAEEGDVDRKIVAPEDPMTGLIGSTDVNSKDLIIRTHKTSGLIEKPVYTYKCTVTNNLPTASTDPVVYTFYVI